MTIIYCKFLVFIISSSCLLYDSIPKKKHFCPICQHEFAFNSITPHLNASTLYLNNVGRSDISDKRIHFILSRMPKYSASYTIREEMSRFSCSDNFDFLSLLPQFVYLKERF